MLKTKCVYLVCADDHVNTLADHYLAVWEVTDHNKLLGYILHTEHLKEVSLISSVKVIVRLKVNEWKKAGYTIIEEKNEINF